jgi:hypothetical protein
MLPLSILDLLLLTAAVQDKAGAAITDDPAKIKFLNTVLRVVGIGKGNQDI